MHVPAFIADLALDDELAAEVVHHEVIRAREATFAEWPPLPEPLLAALRRRGMERPWAHQARALGLVDEGRDVAVVTPTASGKSLVYTLPVLARAMRERGSRALFVYPLKALEQDQLRMVVDLAVAAGLPPDEVAVMDGDTKPTARKRLKAKPPTVTLTTPDMLHYGLLPFHEQWEELFANLRFVVLDELHTYRGVFGSHVAQLLRRLVRVAAHYGASPQWITCSATVANPEDFAARLVGRPFTVVSETTAPQAARHFLFVNPGTSTATRAASLLGRAMDAGLRTIVFTKARKMTELVAQWVAESRPELAPFLSSYRSGYLPEERRDIETALSEGRLLGVVSTSALEMGIDIGGLDVCILVGYPGTVSATWQRGGRVGRGTDESLVMILGGADALDQYFMKNPEDFFRRGPEAVMVDPGNEPILAAHLPCAAAELPLEGDDPWFRPAERPDLMARLEDEGVLLRAHEGPPRWFAARRTPHRLVDLRDVGEGFSILLDEGEGRRVVGSVSFGRALKECHEGAMYLHRGAQYVVRRLDLERRNVFVAPSRARYYTSVQSEKETTVLERLRSRPLDCALLRLGRLEVEETIVGFEKRRIRGGEKMSAHPLELPPQTFQTVGLWLELDDFVLDALRSSGHSVMGSMHALEHAAISLFPLFVACDRNDVGGICYPVHPQVRKGAIFIYDGHPGGVGLAEACYGRLEELLRAVALTVAGCPCESGCPSCIHSPKCGAGNKPLDKAGCLRLTRYLLGEERPPVRSVVGVGAQDEEEWGDEGKSEDSAPPAPRLRSLFFDLETRKGADEVGGWGNVHLMRLAMACVFDGRDGTWYDFGEDQVEDLLALLGEADLVVGFNVKRFDYRVLTAYTTMDFATIPTFDILDAVRDVIGYRLSLGHLAETTLGRPKAGDGLQSLAWVREGRMDLVTRYCREDVALTRDLFRFGVAEGYLLYDRKGAGVVRLPVDWSEERLVDEARVAADAAGAARRGFGRGRRR